MTARSIHLIALAALLTWLSACSIGAKAPALHDLGYPLADAPPETAMPQKPAPVTVEAPKWLDDNRIHYRLLFAAPTQVRFYALDHWIAPPPELFEQLLNNKLRQVPVMISLEAFEQQFSAPNQAKVVMHFTATTMPDKNQEHGISREFKLQLPCATPDAKGAVRAFNGLARQAAENISAWLKAVPSTK